MKFVALALCLAALPAFTLPSVDVTGSWNVDGDVMGNPVKFTTVWKQDGEALSGTATFEENRKVSVTGTVKEQTVTFEFDVEHEGTTYHMTFTGTLDNDSALKGTIAVAGADGTFTAKKQ